MKDSDKASSKRVTFSFFAPHAADVCVAGTFNGWDTRQDKLKKDTEGYWTLVKYLPPGVHEYRFVVDGAWRDDTSCASYCTNPYGGENCILEIDFPQGISGPSAQPKNHIGRWFVMERASKEILRFWKTQWEAYMKTMTAMQEQGETMLVMIEKSGALQEGSLNMVREWAKKYKAIQKSYLDAVEDHFQKLDDIIGTVP